MRRAIIQLTEKGRAEHEHGGYKIRSRLNRSIGTLSRLQSVISCPLCSYDDDFNPGGATTEHGRLSRFPADFAAFG